MSKLHLFLAAPLLIGASSGHAADWPHWRGPANNGSSAETGLLERFPAAGPTVVWQAELGPGIKTGNYRAVGSSPTVAGGKVYVVARDETNTRAASDYVLCFNAADGKELWKQPWKGDSGRLVHSTPTVAEGKLFLLQSTGGLICLDAATGKPIWQKDPKDTKGNFEGNNPSFGASSSPVVDGGVVYVGLSAFHVADGAPVYPAQPWNLYNATALATVAGRKVVCHDGSGYDAATGKQLWELKDCAGIGTPIILGDKLLVFSQDPTADPIAPKSPTCYQIKAVGEKWSLEKLWIQIKVTGFVFHTTNFQNSTAAIAGDHGYFWLGSGAQKYALVCFDLASDAIHWSGDGKALGMAGECYSSPLVADGKIYALDGTGQLFVFRDNPRGCELLAKFSVCGKTYASPVLADGRLYVRDDKKLVCLKMK